MTSLIRGDRSEFHPALVGFTIGSGTSGSVTVKVDGVAAITLTGVNTQATGVNAEQGIKTSQ